MRWVVKRLLLAVAATVSFGFAGEADEDRAQTALFVASGAGDIRAPSERLQSSSGLVKRSRSVSVSREYAAAMFTESSQAHEAEAAQAQPQHTLNLFDDLTLTVTKQKQYVDPQGHTVWIGGIVDDPFGLALIVTDGREITATITSRNSTVTVTPYQDGTHVIREMKPRSSRELFDPAARPLPDYIRPPKAAADPTLDAPARPHTIERPQATTTLRILITYTPKALTKSPNMQAKAASFIAHLNTTFTNSQIDAVAELAGVEQVNYVEGTDSVAILTALADKTGDFARIHSTRVTTQADLVAVIADYGSQSCGVGYLIEDVTSQPVSEFTTKFGTSVVNADCPASTFTHEVGHNIGANHDRFVESSGRPGPDAFNFGYVDTTAKFMDVMAYDNQCNSLGIFCQEIAYFSNPDVNHNSRPVGIVHTDARAANNVRKIREVLPVVATFSNFLGNTVRIGAVYSSAQPDSQSFLRFANTGTAANTVSVSLMNAGTGQSLATWTSPSIAAGEALQVPIATVETALTPGLVKPALYTASIRSSMTGYIQHVLYRPADGTLTNLSTCNAGVTVNATQVANVHTRLLENGYPSIIAITNTSAAADNAPSTASLGIYDANTGVKLVTYTTTSIPPGSQLLLNVSTIEAVLNLNPTPVQYHYVVKLENSFRGALQHLVNNQRASVITDMTTVCAFGTVTPPAAATTRRPGPIFSSAQAQSQSFLRFYNTSQSAGTVRVTLNNFATGATLGTWTSPSIPGGASAQYQITIPEAALGTAAKPQYYATVIQTQFDGYFQHVLYRPADGTLTNLSTCEAGVTAAAGDLINVHSSLLDFGFASSIIVNNPGSSGITAALGVYDAVTGVKLGTYTSPTIAANAALSLPVSTLQTAMTFTPNADQYHYVIRAENNFAGFLQHLVNNRAVGVVTDMSTMCTLPTKVATFQ